MLLCRTDKYRLSQQWAWDRNENVWLVDQGEGWGSSILITPVNPTCTFLLEVVTPGLTTSKYKSFEYILCLAIIVGYCCERLSYSRAQDMCQQSPGNGD